MGKAAYSCRRRREREVDSSQISIIDQTHKAKRCPARALADYSIALRIFRLRARVTVAQSDQSTNEAE